jgi:hypothetical protein
MFLANRVKMPAISTILDFNYNNTLVNSEFNSYKTKPPSLLMRVCISGGPTRT